MNFNDLFSKYKNELFFDDKTYADLLSDSLSFAQKMRPNDLVALQTKSPYFTFVGILACLSKGAVAVLLSHLEKDVMVSKLQSQVPFHLIYRDQDFVFESTDGEFPEVDLSQAAVVVFSSGSSGTPKGIVLTLANLYFSSLGFIETFSMKERETSLINLPHHHVGGLMTMWRSFFSGGKITTDENIAFDFLSLVPLQLKKWMDDEEKLSRLKKARVILIGGAQLNEELKNLAQEQQLKVFETYGMTETASLMTVDGKMLPYRESKIDESGHFLVSGKTLFKGFYVNGTFQERTEEWYKTSDKGTCIDGVYKFVERSDLIFISGGENINPLLLEELVKSHPHIKDAYVVPLPDEKWGQMGVLLYDADKDMETELRQLLKGAIHPHHIPKFFLRTELTLQGQLKIKRSELSSLALELSLKSIFNHDFHEKKNLPTLVVLHGFLGDKEDLKIITSDLRNNYSLLFIDMPGHGKTSAEHFHSLSDFLFKLTTFIKFFPGPYLFYGYSMGGRIALQLALHHITPSILILESTGLGLSSIQEKTERKKNDLALFDEVTQETISSFLNHWYSNSMFKAFKNHSDYRFELRRKELSDIREWKLSQHFLSQADFPLMEENIEQLKKAKFPILYFYGEQDSKYAQYALLLKSLGHKTVKILGAGHNPHKTQASEIKAYLNLALK